MSKLLSFVQAAAEVAEDAAPAEKVKISESLIVFFIGMLVIFGVLLILIGFFYLLKYVSIPKAHKKTEPVKTESPEQPSEVLESDADAKTVAAITAAIACVLSSESGGNSKPFVIKKIKHIL